MSSLEKGSSQPAPQANIISDVRDLAALTVLSPEDAHRQAVAWCLTNVTVRIKGRHGSFVGGKVTFVAPLSEGGKVRVEWPSADGKDKNWRNVDPVELVAWQK